MTHFFILHPGGLGDLVLAAPLLAGLPGRVTIAIREEFGALLPLFPKPPAEWIPLPGNPHTVIGSWPGGAEREAEFARRMGGRPIDVLIDASFRPTWFSPVVQGLAGVPAISVAAAAGRYELPQPERWSLPEDWRVAAVDWLEGQGLTPGEYIVCFPGGAPQALVKRWPAERFVELLRGQERPVLLFGDESEHRLLAELAPMMPGPGAYFAGRPADLALGAALLALGAAYCGNDTGPMHLAQAYRVPGVSFFGGGGEWPHYAPWAPGSIGLVHPLPCFGCRWECCLGRGLCVELLPVAAAAEALREALAAPDSPPAVRAFDTLEPLARQILADAAAVHRATQADRAAGQEVIVGLQRAAEERLTLQVAKHEAAAERGRRLEQWEQRLSALSPPLVRAVQVATGLGAGNIGDELMARAFWKALPGAVTLEVPLFADSAVHRDEYPAQHRYHAVDYSGGEGHIAHWPGLLAGATPVAGDEGLHFPLEFLRTRLRAFTERRIAVDAVGVGVEPLRTAEARALFTEVFGAVRSWTVRSEPSRAALLELGVAAERVRVGADWSWLYSPQLKEEWARRTWREAGVDLERPLVVVNTVNMQWRHATTAVLAEALDRVADRLGAQLAFLANDYRDGDFFDTAAGGDLAACLRHRLVFAPRLYYSADEAIALLSCAAVTVGQRYHFLVQSVLGGTVPVAIARGAKIAELAGDLGLLSAGTVTELDPSHAAAVCVRAYEEREALRGRLAVRRAALRERAANNFSFLRELEPYASVFASR
jgi:polysaccharide pyruvyl transferase WcaK-like protein